MITATFPTARAALQTGDSLLRHERGPRPVRPAGKPGVSL